MDRRTRWKEYCQRISVASVPGSRSGSHDIPVEIYIFSTDQNFREHEKIAAEIIDHIIAVQPLFDLLVFQEPSGIDLRALALEKPA